MRSPGGICGIQRLAPASQLPSWSLTLYALSFAAHILPFYLYLSTSYPPLRARTNSVVATRSETSYVVSLSFFHSTHHAQASSIIHRIAYIIHYSAGTTNTLLAMPVQLLPASAQAFAPRSGPEIVLNTKVEPWLTQTLKRINRIKRPLNSVPQHFRCLTETLGGSNAIWTLASLMLPKAPDSELRKDENPLVEGLFNYQFLHVEAYVVHVDMVSQHEVAFKLTPETIESLVDYHKDIYSVDASASTWSWPEKEAQVKKMQEEFVQAANRFVFRTAARALEGMEEDGAGELLEGRSEEVKNSIMNLFLPLLPPPPRIVDVIHPAPILPNSSVHGGHWWTPQQQSMSHPHPAPVDSWKVLPSTPSPTATSCSDNQSTSFWQDMHLNPIQLPSPTPSFSQPYSSAPSQYYSSPPCMPTMPALPSSLPQHCSTDVGMGGFNDFGWSQSSFAPQYATTV